MMLHSTRLPRALFWLAVIALLGAGCDLDTSFGLRQPAADAVRYTADRTAEDIPDADGTDDSDGTDDGDGADKGDRATDGDGTDAEELPDREQPAPASDGTYGASGTGRGAEACTTAGTRVSNPAAFRSGGTYLLEAGSYGDLRVPSGATVKPYDCAKVTVRGAVSLANGATVAGMKITSDAGWVMRIGGRDITVRHNAIRGGAIETVRIYDDAANVRLVGNRLDGGRNNHVVKVKSERSGHNPADIVIRNNRFTKTYYSSGSEDLLQLEGHRNVRIINNTFSDNPRGEDGVDVKQGTRGMVMRRNRFLGGDINGECLLVQGGYAENIVENNLFEDCKAISLGAHPEAQSSPWWRFGRNLLENSTLRLRRSEDAMVTDSVMIGGVLTLGISGNDDIPRNPTLRGNTFIDVTVANRLVYGYTCADNEMSNMSGDALRCSNTTSPS